MTDKIEVTTIDEALEVVAQNACLSVNDAEDGTDEKTKEVRNLETIMKIQNERDRIRLDEAKLEMDKAKAEYDRKNSNKNFWKDISLTVGQIGAYCGMGLLTIKAAAEYGRMPGDGEKFFRMITNLIKKK